MPNTVPAAAEGLPKVNRRKALAVTGSGIIAALTGVAASTMPAAALPVADENVHAKVRRLSRELSIALDEWTKDWGSDEWVAHIHRYSAREYPVTFENATAAASARDAAARARADEALLATYDTPAMRLFRKWRKLWDASLETNDDDEINRLLAKANRLEKRLVAMPINSPVEYAAKMLAATSFGTFGLGDHEARLIADARQLVGEA